MQAIGKEPFWKDLQSTLPYGSDHFKGYIDDFVLVFQSTLPYGSDTGKNLSLDLNADISIHAPLRERPNTGLIRII